MSVEYNVESGRDSLDADTSELSIIIPTLKERDNLKPLWLLLGSGVVGGGLGSVPAGPL
jgi:hypothetical protein